MPFELITRPVSIPVSIMYEENDCVHIVVGDVVHGSADCVIRDEVIQHKMKLKLKNYLELQIYYWS